MVGLNMDSEARARVLQLMQEKDRIENEIREQTAILETNGNVGMHESLVDEEGYPRNDIDVYKVRHARHRIICLQNDHKAIMKRIEKGLAEVHSQLLPQASSNANSAGTSQPSTPVEHMDTSPSRVTNGHITNGHAAESVAALSNIGAPSFGENDRGFATVGVVNIGSPADMGGLCEGDEILQFGSIRKENFNEISQLMDVVGHSINQNLRVIVRRENRIINLTVSPRPWGQPGLLGCQILRRN